MSPYQAERRQANRRQVERATADRRAAVARLAELGNALDALAVRHASPRQTILDAATAELTLRGMVLEVMA
jgi:hypothetical protein